MLMILSFFKSINPDDTNQSVKPQACLKNIQVWMTSNFVLLNCDTETEFDTPDIILYGFQVFLH